VDGELEQEAQTSHSRNRVQGSPSRRPKRRDHGHGGHTGEGCGPGRLSRACLWSYPHSHRASKCAFHRCTTLGICDLGEPRSWAA
jgi:hypothetical protein